MHSDVVAKSNFIYILGARHCKSIGVTCSTNRRFTKDIEENTRKWPKKGPQRAKNQNFEEQKIAVRSDVPMSIMSKN